MIAKQLLFLLVTSVALFPAPMIAGALIDSTCILWDVANATRLAGAPACVLHDGDRLKRRVHVPLLLAKVILTTAYFLVNYSTIMCRSVFLGQLFMLHGTFHF